jgi:hypothetical protein
MQILRRLREENGMALVFAMGVMTVLAISTVGVITYTSANERHAGRSEAGQNALHLAEAGVNNSEAVLSHDSSNALAATTLSEPDANNCPDGGDCFEQFYEGGRVLWRGDFTEDASGGSWVIHSWGVVPSDTPGAPDVVRYLKGTISVVPSPGQPLNATAWNYVIAWGTSNTTTCDVTLTNTAHIDAPFYVEGNLCLRNTSKVYQPDDESPVQLIVKGKLEVAQGTGNSSKVGESSADADKIDRAEIGGGCTTAIANASHTCNPSSPTSDRVWATTLLNSTTTSVERPTSDFEGWYENANPGPEHACNPVSATPVFDNDSILDLTGNGSAGTIDLTPASSYTCIGKDSYGTTVGEISWDAPSKMLTLSGAIYIDGSVTIDDNVLMKYQGHASLYLTGVFRMSQGNTRLCAAWSGTDCDFTGWDPNEDMLIVVAHGDDGNGNSIAFSQGIQFQGGLFAEKAIDLGQSARVEGPMIGQTVKLSNSVQIKPLPLIDTLPLGAPGNPNTHATPQRPQVSGY